MNLVIVSDDFPEKNHQSYVFVEQLVIALSDLGVNVKVIAPQNVFKQIFRGAERMPKYKQYQTKSGNTYEVYRPKYFSLGSVQWLLRWSFANLRKSVEKVLNKIGEKSIDVLYGHFWHNANAMVQYAQRHSKPLFVACGEGDNAIDELLSTLKEKEKKDITEAVMGVISVSSENKRRVLHYGLAKPEKIEVIPNAVDKTLFYKKDGKTIREKLGVGEADFLICFVGGFIDRKGSNRLSEAITQLNDPTIKSIFIGKARSYDDRTPTCPGIVFMDSLPHDLLPDYLNASDVFVLPTLNEGCSNAIVEALSCGIPVISSNLPFNDDILDETNSIRINPMNVEEIKDAITLLKGNNQLRVNLSKGAIEKSKAFSMEERAKRITNFIQSK